MSNSTHNMKYEGIIKDSLTSIAIFLTSNRVISNVYIRSILYFCLLTIRVNYQIFFSN